MHSLVSEKLLRFRYPGRFSWLDFIGKLEYASTEKCLELQNELLFGILDYSVKNVPYYREAAREAGISPSPGRALEDIRGFPVLTKDILRRRFPGLKSENFRGRSIRKTSGGSTGEPAVFLQDTNSRDKTVATEFLFYRWAGRMPGDRMVRLWGSEEYINKATPGIKGWARLNILNVRILNSYRMSKKNMLGYIDAIREFKPCIVEGYAESLYELARFADENGVELYAPLGVISTAGTLYSVMRSLIERMFKCRVLNRYGSMEAGDMACSCEKNEGLHQNVFNHYLEILDDDLNTCPAGQPGSLYVTTLHNRVMPLIRYRIGDMAVPAENTACSCGRGMPLLADVRGRETEHFTNSRGEMVYAGYFRKLLYGFDWLKQYQVVQETPARFVYYFVKDGGAPVPPREMKKVESGVKNIMGDDCRVEFKFVEHIEPSKSGKFLYTVNKARNSTALRRERGASSG